MSVAKKAQEGDPLPGVDWILGKEEAAAPRDMGERVDADEALLGPLPQPGETPEGPPPQVDVGSQHTDRKAKVAAKKTKGRVKKDKVKRKRGRIERTLMACSTFLAVRLGLIVPKDPIERIRYKLRWIGMIKFPISFIIIAVGAILTMLYLWFLFFDYDPTTMLYSREIPVLLFFVPAGTSMFAAIYFGFNFGLTNRFEERLTKELDGLLEPRIPVVGAIPKGRRSKGIQEANDGSPIYRSQD